MTPIRPLDVVRLRHTPAWVGVVIAVAINQALVDNGKFEIGDRPWVPLELLELVPGQFETLAA